MKRILIIVFFLGLFIIGEANAQGIFGIRNARFLPGKILMEDGTIKSGLVRIPKRPSAQKIKFKESENSTAQNVKIHHIKSFSVTSDLGDTYTFESNYIDQSKNANIKRVTKFRIFLFVQATGHANLYKIGEAYRLDKNGSLVLVAAGHHAVNFRYYVRKEGATYAEIFAYENPMRIGPDVSRRAVVGAMKLHLYEFPELIEKVQSKEIDHTDLRQIFALYNQFMKRTHSAQIQENRIHCFM